MRLLQQFTRYRSELMAVQRAPDCRFRGGPPWPIVQAALIIALFALISIFATPIGAADDISFNRHIRPLLAEHCFTCHGPDANQRQADLRLDTVEGATADLGDRRAIVPGDGAASHLLGRVRSSDPQLRMPPADAGRALTAAEIRLLEQWIAAGAEYERHWAFIPPERPAIPRVKQPGWARNAIDLFVQVRHEREGLTQNPPADSATLLRRLSLDLTGLPPTPAEMEAFLAENSPDGYDRAVERLLASPRLGEHLAARWLDAARYADTNGYQSDGERSMWRWRDWVIEAFNTNQPFDQFTIEQLAGDLLPNPTFEQRLATGFNRNHRGNAEGGIIPEEYAVEYVVDRVETTSTVWLGLTLGCARCHDHKYDPVSQKEFYELYAFFNNVPEKGKAVKFGNSPPVMLAPTREQQAKLRKAEQQLAEAQAEFNRIEAQAVSSQRTWETRLAKTFQAYQQGNPFEIPPAVQDLPDSPITEGLVAHFPFNRDLENALDSADKKPAAETKVHEEAQSKPNPHSAENSIGLETGRLGQAVYLPGKGYLELGDIGHFHYQDRFTLAAWVFPAGEVGTLFSRMTDTARSDGYAVRLEKGRVQVNLVKRWLDDAIRVETMTKLALTRWQHLLVTYDGSRTAAGIQVFFDGVPQPIRVHLDDLNQSFDNEEPFRLGGGGGDSDRFSGKIDDLRIYHRALSPREAAIVAEPTSLVLLASTKPKTRTAGGQAKLTEYYLREQAPLTIRAAYARLLAARAAKVALLEQFPTVMVMEELPKPRATFVLDRGQYDLPREEVTASTPACLPPLASNVSPNRLALAQWLVSPRHPLTARVTVNRLWQMLFGQGIVTTPEDFGTQGAWPSHPELLDWLAVELVDSGWDLKHVLRTIVTSATYRQASNASNAAWARDPDNVLLTRGARFRLSAEAVRDQALAAAGLLVERQGGPSVKPYQPDGLWKDVATIADYEQDHGADLYRRSLYTYFKRTVAPPGMAVFDAAGRETCVVRTGRTNTPLQALTLMNSVAFVEAARVLAAEAMQTEETVDGQLGLAFRRVLSRAPCDEELAVLRRGWERHRQRFAADLPAARELATAGEHPAGAVLDWASHAALTAVVSTLLNLDEAVTRQ